MFSKFYKSRRGGPIEKGLRETSECWFRRRRFGRPTEASHLPGGVLPPGLDASKPFCIRQR